jgi:uncharacterized protein YbjT (DUF2867 family)
VILVVGASGLLGTEICTRLRTCGLPTRAWCAPALRGEGALYALGADIVYGDLKDSTSIDAACAGCATVISPTDRRSLGGFVLRRARQ